MDRRLSTPAPVTGREAAWLFPGLGCRFVGMGGDILGQHPAADSLVSQANDWLGYDVAEVCLTGSARKVVPPRQEAQVIYVVNCAYAAVLRGQGFEPSLVAGHSLGTWSAAQAAGVYDFLTGLQLVTQVEDLMEELLDGRGQTMGVVIGLSEERVTALCQQASRERERPEFAVSLANLNSNGQYVIAGEGEAVDAVLAAAKNAGAYKVKRMPGTRAIHTPLARSVSECLVPILACAPLQAPSVPLANASAGDLLNDLSSIREFLGSFLHLPVRWETTIRTLVARGVRTFVEVGPGGILADMMPFIDKAVSIRTASDLLPEVATV